QNPDVAERARGKAGRLIGHLTAVLTTLKGLPLAYNRDLQEDKEPLFDAVDQVALARAALAGLLASATFDADRMGAAADRPEAAAVDLADHLGKGTPFRDAHAIVGALVRDAVERRLPLSELVEAHPAFDEEAVRLLEPGVAVSRRRTPGGAGPAALADQMKQFRDQLARDRARLD